MNILSALENGLFGLRHAFMVNAGIKSHTSASIELENTPAIPKFIGFSGLEKDHFALSFSVGPQMDAVPLVRVHSECVTGDVFHSKHCDCRQQREEAEQIFSEQGGILLYMRQEGRGIGIANKFAAYAKQAKGMDTYEANRALGLPDDARDYLEAAYMLKAMGINRIRLLTNNPEKVSGLQKYGIAVEEVVPTGTHISSKNKKYLQAKRELTGHTLEVA